MKHYRFGGSTASRTWNCPGWRQLADTLPKGSDSGSEFARRGTLCHNVMEAILGPDEATKDECIGMTYEDQVMTAELYQTKIVPALAAFDELCKEYGINEWEVESESMLADDVGGTSDLIGAGEVWTMILDWKFGDGVAVSPVENHQGLFYGAGAAHNKTVADLFDSRKKVVVAIVQPSRDEGPDYSVWETTMPRIVDYKDQFLAKVEIAESANPATCAGEWCKFCPVAPICPQKTGDAQRALHLKPDDMDTITESLALAQDLKQWIKDVETAAHEQLERGAKIRGWKLVPKRANRAWVDETQALTYLSRRLGKKNVVIEKIIGIPAAEKMLKATEKKFSLDHLVESKSSGTTLAPADDKRPAVPSASAVAAAVKSLR
jgi:hypothetical protein